MASLFSDIGNFIGNAANEVAGEFADALGIGGDSDQFSSARGTPPWGGDDAQRKQFDDTFFPIHYIDPDRWNRVYPYRLLVVSVKGDSPTIFAGTGGPFSYDKTITKAKGETGISYVLSFEVLSKQWIANLPITPQQLNITNQFAIQTSATMRGIVEEHNGLRFKNIVASGTTGIWPRRPTLDGSIKSPTLTRTILGGTLSALEGVADSVTRVANTFSGKHPAGARKAIEPENSEGGRFSTGYYQALYLAQFIERYASMKKNPKFKHLRLVFDIPKQDKSYIVTPITYSLLQSEQKPNEIKFNFQFKAWKEITLLEEGRGSLIQDLPKLNPNILQRIIGTITEVRRVMSRSVNLVKAVRSDFQKPFNILRQTGYAVKDLIGLATSVGDLPRQIGADFRDAIEDGFGGIGSNRGSFASLRGKSNVGGGSQTQSTTNPVISGDLPGKIVAAIRQRNSNNEGLSSSLVTSGSLGDTVSQTKEVDSIKNIFENPEENFEFFDGIAVDDLALSPEQLESIDDELERIRLLTVNDFRDFRADLLSLALDISNNFGSGNQVYSDIYGLPDPNNRAIDLTIEENEILASLFEAIQAFDLLTATKQYDDFHTENPLEYVGGLADDAGIDFDSSSTSKLLVPVPFGLSIEEIAARYLGDPDKWIEIATINKLRSPYVDEDGFELTFLSNAEGRQFNVDDSASQLFIGQKIILNSDTVPAFTRKIISVEKISDGNFLVTVDGLANLGSLTSADNARMQGFLPGTVNSQNQIYIPSDEQTPEDDRIFEISHLDEPNLTKVSKVDFLLTDDFDIALNSLGDFRLANGLTNLVQALKLKIRTRKNTLLRHLDFGLGLTHGISVADIESGDIVQSLNQMVQGDPRFASISRISLRLNGSTLAIDLAINIANSSGIVPITFDIKVA